MTALLTLNGVGAQALTIDVHSMPIVVFTGDSQTCGRVGAMDYPQMLAHEMPVRVINTAVGGTNTRHLLQESSGGTARAVKGEQVIRGEKVGWHAGPYPGQTVRLGGHRYTIDRIETVSYAESRANLWVTEPIFEDFEGTDYAIEPGWDVRVAQRKPDWVCFMYSVNDSGYSSEQFLANIREMADRTRALGAEPIFLSGVPYMEKFKGGSHPGANANVAVRARDLAEFCRREGIPFGDVFSALMALDEHCTSVWADTVHPTTEGSAAIINALRSLFAGLGLADLPRYVRGWRCKADLVAPGRREALAPFTSSQPDYAADNRQDENRFDLAAIRFRDEYGLIADADGHAVTSETPVLLEFGVGPTEGARGASLRLSVAGPAVASWYDWERGEWRAPAEVAGEVTVALPTEALRAGVRDGALWIALQAAGALELDYAGLELAGALPPVLPGPKTGFISWPPGADLSWQPDPASMIRNGDLTQADGEVPLHWARRGAGAAYIRAEVVAEGTGEFVVDKRADTFRAPGQQFTQTVRPLDWLDVRGGPEHATGRFMVSRVVDDENLNLRRHAAEAVSGLSFAISRGSGCLAVPGGCALRCEAGGTWETVCDGLVPGRYVLSFYHRAFAPERMTASYVPGAVARVELAGSQGGQSFVTRDLQSSFQWQKARVEFVWPGNGPVWVRLGSCGQEAAEYTGLALVGG